MKKLILIAAIFFATNSYASILVEPYGGYITGSSDNNISSNNLGISGSIVGGRLGYELLFFFVALDGSVSHVDSKDSKKNVDQNTNTTYGVVAGFDSHMGLRAWGGYNFKDHIVDHTSSQTLDGSSYKVGVGYEFWFFPLSINLECLFGTYNQYNDNDFSANTSFSTAGISSVTSRSFIITASIPLLLF